ncbi:hypothetical protein ABZV58_02900 [Nocardia sp. NPDC004654]|uniref:hypothetical protein n=1 Tax=Nocardia sp. NPDC004654 TaxID=3154776 RepID=UPI0033A2D77B
MITPGLQDDADACPPGLVAVRRIRAEHLDPARRTDAEAFEDFDRGGLAADITGEREVLPIGMDLEFGAARRGALPYGRWLFRVSYARHLPHLLVVLADARVLASFRSLFALRVR